MRDGDGSSRSGWPKGASAARCLFEHVYFARPDSVVFGDSVAEVRRPARRAAGPRGAGRRRHRGAGTRQRASMRRSATPRVGPAVRARHDAQPLRRTDVHRAEAIDPQLRRQGEAQPGARHHRRAAHRADRRFDRARHDLAQDRAHDARGVAPPRSTCASRRRRRAGPATTASTRRAAASSSRRSSRSRRSAPSSRPIPWAICRSTGCSVRWAARARATAPPAGAATTASRSPPTTAARASSSPSAPKKRPEGRVQDEIPRNRSCSLCVDRGAGCIRTGNGRMVTCELRLARRGSRVVPRARHSYVVPPQEQNLWVPHPFSTLEAEIVENVLARHREAYSDVRESELSREDARLFQLSRKGQLRTELVRVADWTPIRCDKRTSERRDAYWLIRFFDSGSGKEITRVLARDSGLISMLAHATSESALPPFPALQVPKEFATELSEASSSSAQYVSTWGPDECNPLVPCVAWRLGAGVALVKGKRLFVVGEHSERFSVRDDLRSNLRMREVAGRIRGQGRELVSLGGDLFAAADVVTKGIAPQDSH